MRETAWAIALVSTGAALGACNFGSDMPSDDGNDSGTGSAGPSASGAQGNGSGAAAAAGGAPSSGAGGSASGGWGSKDGSGGLGGIAVNAGGSESASGGRYAGLGGTFFEGGSELEIPAREQAVRIWVTPSLEGLEGPPIEFVGGITRIVANDGYSKEHSLSVEMTYLFDPERCTSVPNGKLVVEDIEVEEDIDATGATLSLEEAEQDFVLRHEGLGRHQLKIRGTFVANFPHNCPALLDENGELAVTFRQEIKVEEAAGARIALDETCPAEIKALSGESLSGRSVMLIDSEGKEFYADNVEQAYAIDVLVETEREATIADGPAASLNVTGAPQLVRLSTPLGPLLIYELVEPGQVDDWDVQFWVSGRHGFIPNPIESGETYPGGAFDAYEIGADVFLVADGVQLCTLPDWNFTFVGQTPGVCVTEAMALPVTPIATMQTSFGTCAFDMSYPAARDGQGLETSLSVTFVEEQ